MKSVNWKKGKRIIPWLVLFALLFAGCKQVGETQNQGKETVDSEVPMQENVMDSGEKMEQSNGTADGKQDQPESQKTKLPEMGLYKIGESVTADLDGDGAEEIILVSVRPEGYDTVGEAHVTINGIDYYDTVIEPQCEYGPCTDFFYLTNLAPGENWAAIGILYDGPSDDPVTAFYRYDKGELRLIGKTENYPRADGEGLYTDEEGIIHTTMRLAILQTWWTQVEWKLNEAGMLERIPQEFYHTEDMTYWVYTEDGEVITKDTVTLTRELPIYPEPALEGNETTLLSPQEVKFTLTDNEHWCKLVAEDGTEGWFYIEDFGYMPDIDAYAYDGVFEGLCMAD